MEQDRNKNTILVTGDAAVEIASTLLLANIISTEAGDAAFSRAIHRHFPQATDGTWSARTKGPGVVLLVSKKPIASRAHVPGSVALPVGPIMPETAAAEDTSVNNLPLTLRQRLLNAIKFNS